MSRSVARTAARPFPTVLSLALALLAGLLVATLLVAVDQPGSGPQGMRPAAATARKDTTPNPVTPGDFTGYGFDQCLAPTQAKMDRWLTHSPYLAVGIYISGDSRACRHQPNLTPRWVRTQLLKGWRLLPITLGPQASCQPRFPRYSDDVKINPAPGGKGRYGQATRMGRAEADKAVAAAQSLGIVAGSTLWYDLEGYDNTNTHCRESALSFLSGWTSRLHRHGYVSGVYSSASSGIKALDDARRKRPDRFNLPDMIWIARWDGKANTSTSYISEDGWRPGRRVKQYRGGHDEVWGNVRINIDSNFLDVGQGSIARPEAPRCGGVRVNLPRYAVLRPRTESYTPEPASVKALQCLLKEQGVYAGRVSGHYNRRTRAAVRTWRDQHGMPVADSWGAKAWMTLLASGTRPVLKYGSAGDDVRRLQRTLNAVGVGAPVRIDGVFGSSTAAALKAWQKRVGLLANGIAAPDSWALLAQGVRRR